MASLSETVRNTSFNLYIQKQLLSDLYETVRIASILVCNVESLSETVRNTSFTVYMSRLVGKPTMWFLNRSDTNWPEISDLSRRGIVLSE